MVQSVSVFAEGFVRGSDNLGAIIGVVATLVVEAGNVVKAEVALLPPRFSVPIEVQEERGGIDTVESEEDNHATPDVKSADKAADAVTKLVTCPVTVSQVLPLVSVLGYSATLSRLKAEGLSSL